MTILWFGFTMLVSILMLNLLIAMMATTFERIADQQKEEWALQASGSVRGGWVGGWVAHHGRAV